MNTPGEVNTIGRNTIGGTTYSFLGQLTDLFMVDGQALTPDVFGFYKTGKGYISAGSTQATDFRPGQWVPKSPRIIIADINSRGGFGVNGFYLPMNDSNNFGADFHCTPNSIIKLQENLPQPRCRIDGVGDYTGALRDDPFKQYLVLALPFVSGGLQSGFGDYSAAIRGSGIAKSITNSNVSITSTASYYGTAGSFNGTSSQLTIPSSTDFRLSDGDFTIEMWANPNTLKNGNTILSLGTGGVNLYWVLIVGQSSGAVAFGSGNGGWGWTTEPVSQGTVIRTNQWNHVAVVRRSNVLTTYVNGVAVGVTTNHNFGSGHGGTLFIGSYFQNYNNDGYWFDGRIQDLRIYKGVAKYKGGFDVPKPYTPVGIGTWRAVPDCTANNFATFNPLAKSLNGNFYYQNGNLTTGKTVSTWYNESFGSISVSSGKWYWEVNNTAGVDLVVGIAKEDSISFFQDNSAYLGQYSSSWAYASWTGNKINGSGYVSYGSTFQNSSAIIGVALDMDNGTIEFYNNGVSQGVAFTNVAYPVVPAVGDAGGQLTVCTINFGQNPTFSGNTTAGTYTDSNGKGLFKYEPPSGFLALCEDNLPTPAIKNPGEHFKTVLWTGVDDTNKIKCGFQPDLVWIKNRDYTTWHSIYDSIRGPYLELNSNQTSADRDRSVDDGLRSFDSDGFTSGLDDNTGGRAGDSYVAWCWKAGGPAVTNTDGSIISQVSANQTAGFSIVSYTGTGSAGATVGHGLGKPAKFILIKRRSGASNWGVGGSILGANSTLYLNLTNATDTFGDTNLIRNIQTSTTFELGTDTNRNELDGTHIAYCWAEIEGFSKFGSYVGNGSADGPFVFTNGRPAFIMTKRIDGISNWNIIDTSRISSNPNDTFLIANGSNVEFSSYPVDILSNGFKIRNTEGGFNTSGGTYIYACWMESPFTTANAK